MVQFTFDLVGDVAIGKALRRNQNFSLKILKIIKRRIFFDPCQEFAFVRQGHYSVRSDHLSFLRDLNVAQDQH